MAKRPAVRKPRRQHKHPERELRTLEHLIAFALELEVEIMALSQKVTDALAAQDAKLADEAAKLEAFIASHQSNSAADDQAIVDRLAAQGAVVDAMAAKLV